MPEITLTDISRYIINNLNLTVNDGEFLVLMGPNGAGKTTLLNIIAGLIDYSGSVKFNRTNLKNVPTRQRRVGYLFQDLLLFPHLTVEGNISYGLKMQSGSPQQIADRTSEMLELLEISPLRQRYPSTLSGGEQQRVALARALAVKPEVLLLDEPLSSLDYTTSQTLRRELKTLQRRFGLTTIYITHNLAEALEMADRLAIIHQGQIHQLAPPSEVLLAPATAEVQMVLNYPENLFSSASTLEYSS